ncbi:hypothetical protein G3R49_12395 [Shewanella sp. WXL01]|uniref:hypothetical protein n=1 Tax=Shewanella sp. WXL01 TaxID=2709721 RepID=UPI00143857B0|nr:hypothetical protein [Shewanella sp. WXL01]NKF51357.1 hypothetical protein [Shewanella sp. WXL01]
MPPVIVGVAAAYAAAGVVSTAAAIAIGIGAAAATYALTPNVDAGDFSNEAYSQQQMIRSPAEPRRGLYGTGMLSGILAHAEETGEDNKYLHLVIPLVGHECESIEKVYFGDEVAWQKGTGLSSKYRSKARLKMHLGDQTTADANLVADSSIWTEDHIGYGITYIYARLSYDPEVFPNGVPNIKALVKGKKVYDPRLDTTAGGSGSHRIDDQSTWEWSDNWALCVLDYTLNESGVGATLDEVNVESYALAANDCDEFVEYQTDEFEKRYTCNGTYSHDKSPSSILESLLSAGAGTQVYISGQYHLYAGVFQGPEVITLTEDDVAGNVDIRPYTPRSELCNAIRGTFVDPDNYYQPTDFPPHENDYYRAEDNGEYIDHDIDLPFTQSQWTAQRLAKLYLEMNRAGMQITMPVNMIGLAVSVGKVVRVQLPTAGIDGLFVVTSWPFEYGKSINLVLRETTAELYEFEKGSYTEKDLAPNTNLPSPTDVGTVKNVVWQPQADDGNWQGKVSWQQLEGNSTYTYIVSVLDGQDNQVYSTPVNGTECQIPKLDVGDYKVYIWALNMFAARSNVPAVVSLTATMPPNVTGIVADVDALSLTLHPQTSATIASTTEFEVKGSLNTDLTSAEMLGKGKQVVWNGRAANTLYYLWARTINDYGQSDWFGPVGISTSSDNSNIVDLIGGEFNQHVWWAFADDDKGTGFTTSEAIGEGKAWRGIATDKKTSTPSGNWQDYKWSKIDVEIGDVFTEEEQAKLDNLADGKLPNDASKDILAMQDALTDPELANDLITAQKLLDNGIDAADLGGETPSGAQSKASLAAAAAELNAAFDATAKANQAEANANSKAVTLAKSDSLVIDSNFAIEQSTGESWVGKGTIETSNFGGLDWRHLAIACSSDEYNLAYTSSAYRLKAKPGDKLVCKLQYVNSLVSGNDCYVQYKCLNEAGSLVGHIQGVPNSKFNNDGMIHTAEHISSELPVGVASVELQLVARNNVGAGGYFRVSNIDVWTLTDSTNNEVAIETAASDASTKSAAAQQAAQDFAAAEANLAEVKAKAHADTEVTAVEQRAIQDAQNKANQAKLDAISEAAKNALSDSRLNNTLEIPEGLKNTAGTLTFFANRRVGGTENQDVGEIGVGGGYVMTANGDKHTFPNFTLNTPFEGSHSYRGIFYVLFSETQPTSRFTGDHLAFAPGGSHEQRLFCATYDLDTKQWYAHGNTTAPEPFTLLASDRLVAVGSRYNSNGIDAVKTGLSNSDGLDNETAINTAAIDASEKSAAAQQAAQDFAAAEANLAEVKAKAYADGKVSDEERRAIQDAQDKADAAEQAAIKAAEIDATAKADAARDAAAIAFVNMIDPGCGDFETVPADTSMGLSGNAQTVTVIATGGYTGEKCLEVVTKSSGYGAGAYFTLGSSYGRNYPIALRPGGRFLVTYWVKPIGFSNPSCRAYYNSLGNVQHASGYQAVSLNSGEWGQFAGIIDMSASPSVNEARFRFWCSNIPPNCSILVDLVSIFDVTDSPHITESNYPKQYAKCLDYSHWSNQAGMPADAQKLGNNWTEVPASGADKTNYNDSRVANDVAITAAAADASTKAANAVTESNEYALAGIQSNSLIFDNDFSIQYQGKAESWTNASIEQIDGVFGDEVHLNIQPAQLNVYKVVQTHTLYRLKVGAGQQLLCKVRYLCNLASSTLAYLQYQFWDANNQVIGYSGAIDGSMIIKDGVIRDAEKISAVTPAGTVNVALQVAVKSIDSNAGALKISHVDVWRVAENTHNANAVADVAAGNFTATTGLVQKLLANQLLVNQAIIQFANVGGLTAQAIAAQAIDVTKLSVSEAMMRALFADSALVNTFKAQIAAISKLTVNELLVDEALINNLVGTSALFDVLKARIGFYGGLTVNELAAGSVDTEQLRAGVKLSSPVIEGGQVRLVGSGYMKVQAAEAFGPDGLIEWYGPKLLSNGEPNWTQLKKSNAITYLAADGDAYFGGTLSAGVLKTSSATSDKNTYTAGGYPVSIGPFGTNGKTKQIVVSYYLGGRSQNASEPNNPTQPKLSWQLQRKIGSGSWGTIASGTFTGSVSWEYDGEFSHWEVNSHCTGSQTITDNNTSTDDFEYRIKVISHARYHGSYSTTNQNLSLVCTEE